MIISIFNDTILYGIDYSEQWAETHTITPEDYARIQSGRAMFDLTSKTVVDLPVLESPQEESVVTVPQKITNRQLRLALIEKGISLASVDQAINAVQDSTLKEKLTVLREYSGDFARDDEQLKMMATALTIDDEQLDAIFILWSTL